MKKMKIYLNTNVMLDFFINQAKASRNKIKPKMPTKLKFFIDNSSQFIFITSVITKAEIARELAAGYGVSEEKIERLWTEFTELLNCKFIERVEIGPDFAIFPAKIKLKLRTLMNFQHLFAAMENDAYLLSGDKDLIKISRENKIYSKVMSYIELREKIS